MVHVSSRSEISPSPFAFGDPLLKAVEAYENDGVLYRFQSKLALNQRDAEQLFLDTKRYLFICATHSVRGPFSPTPAIDDGWHEFLMFTEDYQNFCLRFFRQFLHHRPFTPSFTGVPGGIYRTYVVARELFGDDLSTNWMVPEGVSNLGNCSCGGSCGGGCNSGSCSSG
jgi:hypothetical protein